MFEKAETILRFYTQLQKVTCDSTKKHGTISVSLLLFMYLYRQGGICVSK